MAYTTAFGLPQEVVDYLNRQLPDIDNIFSSTSPDQDTDTDTDTDTGITKPYWEDGYPPGTNPDPNSTRMPSKYIDYLAKEPSKTDYGFDNSGNFIGEGPGEEDGLLKNLFPGWGAAKGIIEGILPMNRTAIMNNEMLGQGFAIDNNGKIVRMGGDYDTAGNIMADYNVSRMDEKTFDDRIANLKMKPGPEREARIKAILEAKEAWKKANTKTDHVWDWKYKDRPGYRMSDTRTNMFLDEAANREAEKIKEWEKTNDLDFSRRENIHGASVDVGYWEQQKKPGGKGETWTPAEIRADKTGMFTEDPSGIGDGGNDPGTSNNDDWSNWGEYNRGGRVGLFEGGGMTNIKGQDHMLAYITPNEVNKLQALGGQETMTPEGIPAYPEWDSMYGAESKEAFDAGQAPKGNVNWSGGGDGGNNNQKKTFMPSSSKDVVKTGLLNFGLNKWGRRYIHPALLIKEIYNQFKNPKDEDMILSENANADNLYAEGGLASLWPK